MMHTIVMVIPTPDPFDFAVTVESHGWAQLAPFRWEPAKGRLTRPEATTAGVVEMTLHGGTNGQAGGHVLLEIQHECRPTAAMAEDLVSRAQRILGLADDLQEFYRLCQGRPGFEGVKAHKKGRLLRCSTLFEDIVKTILTTNVNWAGTCRMVRRLVEELGTPLPWNPAMRTFPTAEQLLARADELTSGGPGLGYRGAYLADLARKVVSGVVDLSQLEDGNRDSDEVYASLRALRGIGDYAASSLLMLLGRRERIPVDSWARKLIKEQYYQGRDVSDGDIANAFGEFGAYRGLAYWFFDWSD